MEFKKIYVEITNVCNLNCKFCIGHNRTPKFMSIEEFRIVLNKLQGFTKYLYFHVMGEPLNHPQINDFINEASETYFVNITTNGYFIDKIKDNKKIRQLNISLHDYDESGNKSLDDYLTTVFEVSKKLADNGTIISFRMWSRNKHKDEIIKKLNQFWETRIDGQISTKLTNNIYYEIENEFMWPSMNNNFYSEIGSCYGTRTHVAILVSGDVVPCCLDSHGIIKLGNIYNEELSDIINGTEFQKIKKGFLDNKKIHELCRHCNFKRS